MTPSYPRAAGRRSGRVAGGEPPRRPPVTAGPVFISPVFIGLILISLVVAVSLAGCGSGPGGTGTTSDPYASGGTATTAVPAGGETTTTGPDAGPGTGEGSVTDSPRVELTTSMGTVVLRLDAAAAPITVENFLAYVESGFYDGTVFHRVIPGFMAQGGGFTPDLQQKATQPPIKNEAGNGLKNLRGTVAMARTMVVDSATAQFFVNVVDNAFLDHASETPKGFGYAVFGSVESGMEVVDAMVAVPTKSVGQFQDVPVTPIVIERAVVLPAE